MADLENHEVSPEDVALKLSRLEVAVENTQGNINQLAQATEKQIANLAETFDRQLENFVKATQENHTSLTKSVERLASRQQDLYRTPWANIIAFTALVVTVVGMIGVGFIGQPLRQLEGSLEKLELQYDTHTFDGHSATVKKTIEQTKHELDVILDKHRKRFEEILVWKEEWTAKRLPLDAEQSTKIAELIKEQDAMQKILGELVESENRQVEQLHAMERDLYNSTSYKAGRPMRGLSDNSN